MMDRFLPEEIRVARIELGISLREAAKRTGVTKETLSDIERGIRMPHPSTIKKIADGYGVPTSRFLKSRQEVLSSLEFREPSPPEPGRKAQAPPSPAEAEGVKVQTYSIPLNKVAKAAASPAEEEERRSAELELERLQRQEMEKWEREDLEVRLREERDERLAGSVRLFRNYTEALEMIMEKDPDIATVKALVETADEMAVLGFGAYVRLNPDERDSEEVGLEEFEAAITKLVKTTERMVGQQQEAREKDEGELGELIQLHQRLASRRSA